MTKYVYDALGRVTQEDDPAGSGGTPVTTNQYGYFDQVVQTTAPNGGVTQRTTSAGAGVMDQDPRRLRLGDDDLPHHELRLRPRRQFDHDEQLELRPRRRPTLPISRTPARR